MSSLNNTFSYSGSDCRAFAIKGSTEIELKSLNTISVSVYESKSPVRRLGHRNVVGFTKSIRTIAGSIILTVIEEHPLQELHRNFGKENVYSVDSDLGYVFGNSETEKTNRLATLLPDFDLILYYKSEYYDRGRNEGKEVYAKSKIKGIEFINESIVTSINDMVTEISLQFVAKEFDEFSGYITVGGRQQSQVERNTSNEEVDNNQTRLTTIDPTTNTIEESVLPSVSMESDLNPYGSRLAKNALNQLEDEDDIEIQNILRALSQ